jgi:hypothetical protein
VLLMGTLIQELGWLYPRDERARPAAGRKGGTPMAGPRAAIETWLADRCAQSAIEIYLNQLSFSPISFSQTNR